MLSNTYVKFVGSNSPTTLGTLAKELGVKQEVLQRLNKYEFYTKVGKQPLTLIKTTDHLSNRAYQLSKEERKELREHILYSGQYRSTKEEKREEKIFQEPSQAPSDEHGNNEHRPKPKFSFDDEDND